MIFRERDQYLRSVVQSLLSAFLQVTVTNCEMIQQRKEVGVASHTSHIWRMSYCLLMSVINDIMLATEVV